MIATWTTSQNQGKKNNVHIKTLSMKNKFFGKYEKGA